MEQKKISSKINYDVLRDLNSKGSSSPTQDEEGSEEGGSAKKPSTSRKSANSRSLSTPVSNMRKRYSTVLVITLQTFQKGGVGRAFCHYGLFSFPVPGGFVFTINTHGIIGP